MVLVGYKAPSWVSEGEWGLGPRRTSPGVYVKLSVTRAVQCVGPYYLDADLAPAYYGVSHDEENTVSY